MAFVIPNMFDLVRGQLAGQSAINNEIKNFGDLQRARTAETVKLQAQDNYDALYGYQDAYRQYTSLGLSPLQAFQATASRTSNPFVAGMALNANANATGLMANNAMLSARVGNTAPATNLMQSYGARDPFDGDPNSLIQFLPGGNGYMVNKQNADEAMGYVPNTTAASIANQKVTTLSQMLTPTAPTTPSYAAKPPTFTSIPAQAPALNQSSQFYGPSYGRPPAPSYAPGSFNQQTPRVPTSGYINGY